MWGPLKGGSLKLLEEPRTFVTCPSVTYLKLKEKNFIANAAYSLLKVRSNIYKA